MNPVYPVYPVCFVVLVLGVLVFIGYRETVRVRVASPPPEPLPVVFENIEPAPAIGIARLWRDRIVVTMKTGESFAGVLWEQTDRDLVLRGAEALGLGENGAGLPVDGELLIFIADIAYVQKP